ncbi:3-oxoacyl-[acyl-carrier protein] reductase [Mesobacillus persicus]|uniref:3-oxoacyl-[acyl-carrier protein] reductase n=1 Tax=Mesobacillus persicus TaxID=930146 RepID=A0A1H8E9A8_9BACI|nr:SDR family oxidoreductase [Mesobacillus persicus]SEN16053.1 3-oxoacyl-[acyl-carrier protein] reductase [Mesobacillus persicus]
MTRFADCVAVVTGAGSGIGKAAAARLAVEGAKVILVGRTTSKLEAAAREINATQKIPAAEVFTADVTDEEDLVELRQYIEQQYGDLHILINNAGGSSNTKILEMDGKEWDRIQEVNLKSVFLTAKVLGGLMVNGAERSRSQDNRSIVNVASLSGHQAGAAIPHYSAAKAGVINLTRSLALELAPYGIRVNSVSPGFIETPLTEKGLQNDKFVKAIERNTALQRVGKAEEIANIITFVASSEASYMTGSDVLADGGWLIK